MGGKTASEGVEFDLTGTIIHGLNFIIGFGNAINYFAHDNYSINPIAPRVKSVIKLVNIYEVVLRLI